MTYSAPCTRCDCETPYVICNSCWSGIEEQWADQFYAEMESQREAQYYAEMEAQQEAQYYAEREEAQYERG